MFFLACSRASGEGGRQDGVTTALQEGGHHGRHTHNTGDQTAAPVKKLSKKASPPKEHSLEDQAIAQATAVRMKEETLAAKRLQVDNNEVKREKARSPLELLE